MPKPAAVPATKPRAKAPTAHEQRTLELAAEVTLRTTAAAEAAERVYELRRQLKSASEASDAANHLLTSARAAMDDHLGGTS